MRTKFDFRRFFPISYYRLKKGYDFNNEIFLLDCLIYPVALIIIAIFAIIL